MSTSNDSSSQGTSPRPYLIRALHEWCTDNGFTPYLAVYVDRSVQVPQEYVKNNEIVLNVSFEATSQLQLGNEYIEFKARFGGMARDICVPVDHVIAIYARENGQGMAFPVASSPTHAGPQMVGLGPVGMPQPGPAGAGPAVSQGALPRADGSDAGVGSPAGEAPKTSSATDAAPRDARPVHLVPPTPGAAPAPQTPIDEPPKPSGGSRPSLKRIK